jgi:hypothetical protein
MSYYKKINELHQLKNTFIKKRDTLNKKIDIINNGIATLRFIEDIETSDRMKKKKEKNILVITDVKQMHNKPSKRCYIYSIDNVPLYQLDFIWNNSQRWYGWVGVTTDSVVTSIINPFFPMSDTAKGAVKNELGTHKSVPKWTKIINCPIIIYEFKNFEQMKKYFPPLDLNIKYIDYKTQNLKRAEL